MQPKKRTMFDQELLATSAVEKEMVGTVREDIKGNKYVMAKAGATALAAGKMTIAAVIPATVMNKTGAAYAVGSTYLKLTIAGATFDENQFRGGQLQINDEAGEGHKYEIVGSSAVTAGTTIYVSISDGLRVAMTAASEFTLVHSPYLGSTISATAENRATGIPLVNVPAGHFYWSQVGGDAICLMVGTTVINSMLTLGTTAGSVTSISATLDVDQAIIGQCWGTAGVATEYKPVRLTIM